MSSNNFGCNICLELPNEPIVTLCGHLYCWPCLYKWLHFNSQSNHCPVCHTFIKEDSLVPLYGVGKPSCDPRLKPVHGDDVTVPNRPSATRMIETAPTRIETARPDHYGQRHRQSSFFGRYSGVALMPRGTRFGNTLL